MPVGHGFDLLGAQIGADDDGIALMHGFDLLGSERGASVTVTTMLASVRVDGISPRAALTFGGAVVAAAAAGAIYLATH